MNRTWRNWAPAVAVTAAVGAGALVVPLTANAAVDLPDRTAAEVLELAAGHSVDTLSGTVEQTSDLGLPDLSMISGAGGGMNGRPGMDPGAAPGTDPVQSGPPTTQGAMLELLTAPHTARIFLDGPSQARIQVLDEMAERNIILNDGELWFYDSEDNSAVHTTVSQQGEATANLADVPTPDQLAALFLEKADASTEVTVGPDRTVAGRAAYQLILTPRADETLVGSITIDVDGETGLPLAVSVAAAGGDTPAFSAAYTDIAFEAPPADIFDFTPPVGATVTEVPDSAESRHPDPATPGTGHAADRTKPTVTGTGWETVVEFDAGDMATGDAGITGMIDQMGTPVEDGQLLQTRLLNILVTDDGRVLAGSVPADRLQAVANDE